MRVILLTFILSFFCIYSLNAQDPYYINYGTKDGLPSQEVYDVEVDSSGLVWFSTDRGVCTFDGYDFKIYSTQDGLGDNVNFEIFKDSKERLWFNGYRGEVSFFENGQFRTIFGNDTLIKLLNKVWLSCVIESEDGSFYGMGYRCVLEDIAVIQLFQDQIPEEINKSEIYEKFEVIKINETYLISLGDYGFAANPIVTADLFGNYLSTEAYQVNDYWFYRSEKGIHKFNKESKTHSQYTFDEEVSGIYIDRKNDLWVPTNKGLYFFGKGLLNKEPIVYFKDQNITNLTEDKEGAFWLTSTQNGIYYIPSFDVVPVVNIGLEKNYFSIGALKQHIVFGGKNSKILTIDSLSRISNYFASEEMLIDIRFISKRLNKQLDLAYVSIVEEGGQLNFEYEDKTFQRSSIELNSDDFFVVYSDRGFSIVNEKDTLFSGSWDNPFIFGVTSVLKMDEIIWVGSLGGLYKMDNYKNKKIEEELINEKESFGRINDMVSDQYGSRWVATIGNGLFYHTNDKTFPIKQEDGLNSDMINHILLLNDSTVYVATNKGINAFNYKYEKDSLIYSDIKNLTISDGLISNFINDVDFWKGKIWLATDNGICYFDPQYINKEFPEIPVIINEFVVNDSSYNINEELVFEKNENDIFIVFTGISFRKGNEKKFYRYRLISDDEALNWIYTNDKSISYNNMTPGTYTFEVAARNKSDIWTSSPTKLSFIINPHVTETFWFRSLLFFIISSILGLIIYFQFRRFKSREYEKRRLQEAELNALRNQMNPHFVFNSLNAIQSFMFKEDVENANYYMSKFSVLMRNSLQYTRLDFITLQEEIEFVKTYLELEAMRFSGKFEYKINIQDSIDPDFIQVPSLLLQPILENSIKHAFKNINYKGLITLDIKEKDENSLEVYLQDNGVGYADAVGGIDKLKTKHKSFGLEIVKERIALLNSGDNATKASIDFANISDNIKDKSGLQVHIVLPIKNV